jgi:hypothetical protein
MRRNQITTDWSAAIEQLRYEGLTLRDIGASMGLELSARMMQAYKHGAQPAHWRGEGLIALWCAKVNRSRDQLPTMLLVRGHRAQSRTEESAPRLQSLPQWPPAPSPAVVPVKRGRPKKVAEVT